MQDEEVISQVKLKHYRVLRRQNPKACYRKWNCIVLTLHWSLFNYFQVLLPVLLLEYCTTTSNIRPLDHAVPLLSVCMSLILSYVELFQLSACSVTVDKKLMSHAHESCSLRSASKSFCDVPGPKDCKTKYGQRAFRYIAPSQEHQRQTILICYSLLSRHTSFVVACNSASHLSALWVCVCVSYGVRV